MDGKKLKDCILRKIPVNGTLKTCIIVLVFNACLSTSAAQQVTKSISLTQSSVSVKVRQGETESVPEYISTSDNEPVSARLTAVDNTGNIAPWVTVNSKYLNGISYTTGSEISFNIDATDLSTGTYSAIVTAVAPGYKNGVLKIDFLVAQGLTGTHLKINFQDSQTVTPTGWLCDYGQALGKRFSAMQGEGNVYGWRKRLEKTPLDLTKNARRRRTPSDILLSTLIHMQAIDLPSFAGTRAEGIWEAQVVDGNYEVSVCVGDGEQVNSRHFINIEGVSAIKSFLPNAGVRFKSATAIISVSDGYLTIDAAGGTNTKLNWVTIKPYFGKRPSVVSVNPEKNSKNISENTSISTNVLKLPNSGINNATISPRSVYLTEETTSAIIPSTANGTGGGDAITLVPSSALKLNTTYRISITSGLKDLNDSSFIPYSSSFTTGSSRSTNLINVGFEKINLPNTAGQHSSLIVGPDSRLYAMSIDGIIKRFIINSDGTLGKPELLYSVQDKYGSRTRRLAVGFTFDPSATATNLVAWVTHNTYVFQNAPDWDGKLTRLSGQKLEKVEDIIIHLPRSKKDHVTNSIAFGPDGALYFTQGSTSAMGRADRTWGYRSEHLLSASVLRLDISKLRTLPLDVKTSEGGGGYNPYNSDAPLTIYASGVRNAYDLVWHRNGELYVPANSSASGGNTPASINGTLRTDGSTYAGPAVPALTNVQLTPTDFLYKITRGGYYGHPNPLRGEFVLNAGNAGSSTDPAQVKDYPLGTQPDPNWRGYSFDFNVHASPNGAIEYKSNTFNGALKGKLLVVRYSQHKDVITLTPGGPEKHIVSATEGYQIEGFSGFNDPIDLTEDTIKGNLYLSEYGGGGQIVLLRPGTAIRHDVPTVMPMQLSPVNPSCDAPSEGTRVPLPLVLANSNFQKIKVYPNPIHKKFNIQFENRYENSLVLQIVDALGKTWELGRHELRPGGTNIKVDLSNKYLEAGVYFLKISTDTKTDLIKLIIQ